MSVKLPFAVAAAACDLINDLIDAGATAGQLIVYDGTRPADADTAVTDQTALVTFTLADPAFGDAVQTAAGATATANAISPVQASADGTATWFRIVDGDGNAVIDGEVTDTAGNGDLKLSSTAIITGIDVTVVSLTTTMPMG